MTGKFITFEGVEGCGKSTQMEEAYRFLAGKKIPIVATREPGGTTIGNEIRNILLNRAHHGMQALTELLLYLAARAQHVKEVIRPALEAGKIVLCDRFHDSTLAYQGYGRGIDMDTISKLNALATDGIVPDLTFLLDIDVEEGLERARQRSAQMSAGTHRVGARLDRFEEDTLEFHRRIRAGYLTLAMQDPRRYVLIPAAGTPDDVRSRVLETLGRFLKEHYERL
ncbi:MAG: dTMP kinase [Candidatus Tectomicrobia bacterium]|uniref:Thymidylate kinase n=1 Tax=Tectimicrobiota bacterium TaxID=2528274 RepID=A0A932LZM2_UNCTE|nr:dTMP kinase [Candidatus Tectomicrobia bacterium]